MSKLALFGGDPVRKKPFHGWPVYGEEEEENLLSVLRKNKWGIGNRVGVVNQFEEEFAKYHNIAYAVACANCTQALEIALSVFGVGFGDEVIVPAYTFIATASAPAKLGAVPVFADIDRDTLLIDPKSVEAAITPRTKAIVPVHFAGQFADLEALTDIACKHRLVIVEDAAQAHGAKWNGVCPGAYSPAAFSFQYSKNMTAGEGGIIVSDDKVFIEDCWEHIWHGRKKGGVWYEHFETTSNHRMTEWSAAVLLAQLKRLDFQNKKRMENADYLISLLNIDKFLSPPLQDPLTEVHARHLFPLRINREKFSAISKERIVKALVAEGIPMMPGYGFPVYKNPAFQSGSWGLKGVLKHYDYSEVFLPGAESACNDTIWILHNVLLGTKEDMEDIYLGIKKVGENVGNL